MLPLMQLQFDITLQDDNELISMNTGVDEGRVVINRFLLWVPRLIPNDRLYVKFADKYLQPSKWIMSIWTCLNVSP